MRNLDVPVLTNHSLSLKASQREPEIQILFDSLALMDLNLKILPFQAGRTGQIPRADFSVEHSLQLMQRMKKLRSGVLVLKLAAINEPSFANLIVRFASQQGWPVFIYGLKPTDANKMQCLLDPSFKTLPSGLTEETEQEIYSNFQRPLYRENFKERINRFPALPQSAKTTLQSLLEGATDLRTSIPKATLMNLVLILDFWEKYANLLINLLEVLAANKKDQQHYYTRLAFNLMLSDENIENLKKQLAPALDLDGRDKLAEIRAKDEFFLYVSLALNKNETGQIFTVMLNGLYRIFASEKLAADAKIFNQAHFIPSYPEEKGQFFLQYLQTVVSITQKSEDLADKKQLGSWEEQATKTTYVSHLAHYSLAGVNPKFVPNNFKDRTSYKDFARTVVGLPVYAVDRILLNPWINEQSSVNFIVSKVLHQVQLSDALLNDLKIQAATLLHPEALEIRQYAEKRAQEVLGEQASKSGLSFEKFIETILETLPFLDYLLVPAPEAKVELEMMFAKMAKRSLGLYPDSKDGTQGVDDRYFGYQNLLVYAWNRQSDYTYPLAWAKRLYNNFLKNQLIYIYRTYVVPQVNLYQAQITQPLCFFLLALHQQKIYITYQELAHLLVKYSIITPQQLNLWGYSSQDLNPFFVGGQALKELKLLEDLKDPPESDARIEAEKLYKRQLALREAFLKIFVSYSRPNPENNEARNYVQKFFAQLSSKKIVDIFAPEATLLLPVHAPLETIKLMIQEHFVTFFQSLPKTPPAFLLSVPEGFHFLCFFCRDLSVDIGLQRIDVLFYPVTSVKNSLQNEWKKEILFKSLNEKLGPALRVMQEIWRILTEYIKVYSNMVSGSSMLLINEMLYQGIEKNRRPKREANDLHTINPADILIIYRTLPKEVGYFSNRKDVQLLSTREVLEGFYSLKKTKEQNVDYAILFDALNQQLSLIPLIRYAPINLKLLRQNLDRLAQFFHTKVADIQEQNLKEINDLSLHSWNLIQEILKEESQVPVRYRYLNYALNTLELRVNKTYKNAILQFFRGSFESQGSSTKMKEQALLTFGLALQFKGILEQKQYFFLFPQQAPKDDVVSIIQNLYIYKGLNSEIYIDQKSSLYLDRELEAYIDKNAILDL